MLYFVYNFFIFIYCFIFSFKIIYQFIFNNKVFSNPLKRLAIGLRFEKKNNKKVIWIHAVSLGEMKASLEYIKDLQKNIKNYYIIVSTATSTGMGYAKKNIKANNYLYLPLDFSFIFKYIFKKLIKPDFIILVETDFWFNFLIQAKKIGAKIILINGKMSDKSFCFYKKVPFFSKRLFSLFDLICVQNDRYKQLFLQFNVDKNNIHVTGNLKFNNIEKINEKELCFWKKKLFFDEYIFITIASTHNDEEKLILKSLDKFLSENKNIKILLAPRHPERFKQVDKILKPYNYIRLSKLEHEDNIGDKKIVLIDRMGFLPNCFSLSYCTIMGGSFIKKVGGHNIVEPLLYNCFVFFGPFLHAQKDMMELVLKYNYGKQVTYSNINENFSSFFKKKDTPIFNDLINSLGDPLQKTLSFSYKVFENKFNY